MKINATDHDGYEVFVEAGKCVLSIPRQRDIRQSNKNKEVAECSREVLAVALERQVTLCTDVGNNGHGHTVIMISPSCSMR